MKLPLNTILGKTLEVFGLTAKEYKAISNSRERLAIEVKQAVCYLAQKFGHAQNAIGIFLGLDHSTVHHNKKTAQDICDYDVEYANRLMRIWNILEDLEKKANEIIINGYISRDERGDLTLWSEEPSRDSFANGEGFWFGESPRELDPTFYPHITWESEPQACEIKIILK